MRGICVAILPVCGFVADVRVNAYVREGSGRIGKPVATGFEDHGTADHFNVARTVLHYLSYLGNPYIPC